MLRGFCFWTIFITLMLPVEVRIMPTTRSYQYLWPLVITTKESCYTLLIGINRMLAVGDALVEWPVVMATTLLAMLPPVAVVVLMQRSFIAGMTETEK